MTWDPNSGKPFRPNPCFWGAEAAKFYRAIEITGASPSAIVQILVRDRMPVDDEGWPLDPMTGRRLFADGESEDDEQEVLPMTG